MTDAGGLGGQVSSTDERSGDAREATRAFPPDDGDDIVVIPGDTGESGKRARGRPFLIGVTTLALLVAVGVIAFLARDDSSPRVQTTAPPPAPTVPIVAKKSPTTVVRKTPKPTVAV